MNLIIKNIIKISLIIILCCFVSGCAHAELSEESQKELELDSEHAVADAEEYLRKKYDMDFELTSFEPCIYCFTSDPDWQAHYDGIWEGKFVIEEKVYEINGNFITNEFKDSYQYDEIRTAYTNLVQQYLADIWGKERVEYEVVTGSLFNLYYDEKNLYEILKENGIRIHVYSDEELGQEFWDKVANDVAKLREDYEEVEITIFSNDNYLVGF